MVCHHDGLLFSRSCQLLEEIQIERTVGVFRIDADAGTTDQHDIDPFLAQVVGHIGGESPMENPASDVTAVSPCGGDAAVPAEAGPAVPDRRR